MGTPHLHVVHAIPLPLPQPIVPSGTGLLDANLLPIGANAESEQDPHRALLQAQWKWCWALRRLYSQAILDWWRVFRLA